MVLPIFLEEDQLGLWWATTLVGDHLILSEACASPEDAKAEMRKLVREWEGIEVSDWKEVETL